MAKKDELLQTEVTAAENANENAAAEATAAPKKEKQQIIDVTKTKVKIKLERPRPGEETEIFVSNGRENVLVKKGVEVSVPYWVFMILQQRDDAEIVAYNYENYSAGRSASL
ncbi:MAG: hypothetical protein IJ157_06605 [Clostridia bacterium]|nr:hypothetical protein [Clostridia bacterium]